MSCLRRKSREINKITYYDNKINYHLSPHQGIIPELDEEPSAPVGSIIAYTMPISPKGWLICDGTAIKRYDYKELFEVIGTTFGSGDGTTTFNLPNYKGAFLRGTGAVGNYAGPPLNNSQPHATQTHNHLATSTVGDPKHSHAYKDGYFLENTGLIGPNNLDGHSGGDKDNSIVERNMTTDAVLSGITVTTTVDNSTLSVNANETRPYNFGINWIIKY
jgi:microcystin-dependent protein